ncbi:MAG: PD-(D/E)XK nuclease family protein [bacterium]|nr:PD-(D/E)XK nuclease family protein [bacterium]
MRISYSALNTYKTCPLQFKFQTLDKIRAPKNIEMVFGTAVHSALNFMFERTPLYPTLDEIIDFFCVNWDEKTQIFSDEEFAEKKKVYREEGVKLLKNFYKKNQPWNFNAIDLETRFEVELEDPKTKEKHSLTGIIDRVDKNMDDESYEIIDYKTSKKMPSQDIVDQDLQLSIYHMGLLKRWPHLDPQKIKLSLYFVKHGEKISTSRSAKQLEETKQLILETINEINERAANHNDFPPHPSALCDWCGYRQMCPMWKHLYKTPDAEHKTQEDIEPVVREYFDIKEQSQQNKERLDELKTVIYGFMDDQKIERVFGEEGYVTRTTRESVSYDTEKAKEILEPINKWSEVLSADEKKLEKLLADLPEDARQKLLTLRSTKQITTLTASKKKVKE